MYTSGKGNNTSLLSSSASLISAPVRYNLGESYSLKALVWCWCIPASCANLDLEGGNTLLFMLTSIYCFGLV